jgi:hypothetical protein
LKLNIHINQMSMFSFNLAYIGSSSISWVKHINVVTWRRCWIWVPQPWYQNQCQCVQFCIAWNYKFKSLYNWLSSYQYLRLWKDLFFTSPHTYSKCFDQYHHLLPFILMIINLASRSSFKTNLLNITHINHVP